MFLPRYTISNKIVSQLTEIAEIKALVAKSSLLPEREMFLRRAAVIKMAHSSTSIEGNELNEYQVEQVIEGKRVSADERQILEVKNYLLALKEVDMLADKTKNMKLENILKIHRIVTNGLVDEKKSGAFRPGQVYIVNVSHHGGEEVVYLPPEFTDVPMCINDLLDWLGKNQEVHPILRAGIFHYQFEAIHPFTDGNGRTGRLLTLLHLYLSGWDFRKILVLEDYYNGNRKAYYEALQTGSTYKDRLGVDLTNWLEYFVEGFLSEARKVKDQALSLSVISNVNFSRNVLNKDEIKIVDFVVTMGQITSADVVDILSVPKRTAQAKLKKLEDIKVLKKSGSGPKTFYVISSVE